ncbi:hypothetical protein FRC09_011778, partial [Ceratobasidium sp. 395]
MDPRYQYPDTPTTASTSASDVQWAFGPAGQRPYTGAGAGDDLYEDDEYVESEDEDVFAWLPPTTAEAQAQQQEQQQQQQQQAGRIQPGSAPLASAQPLSYPATRPAVSSPSPAPQATTPVHAAYPRQLPTTASDQSFDRHAPQESFRMRALRDRVPRQNKTPE